MKNFKLNIAAVVAISSAIISISNAKEGGSSVGNGGDVVICTEDSGATSIEMLDAFEARTIDKRTVELGDSSLAFMDKAALALMRLKPTMPNLYAALEPDLTQFQNNVAFTSEPLTDLPDMGETQIPANCAVHQIAIRNPNSLPYGKEFIVYSPYWNLLSANQKAALVLHEVIYKYMRDIRHDQTSINSRLMNRKLLTDEFAQSNMKEIRDFATNHGFDSEPWFLKAEFYDNGKLKSFSVVRSGDSPIFWPRTNVDGFSIQGDVRLFNPKTSCSWDPTCEKDIVYLDENGYPDNRGASCFKGITKAKIEGNDYSVSAEACVRFSYDPNTKISSPNALPIESAHFLFGGKEVTVSGVLDSAKHEIRYSGVKKADLELFPETVTQKGIDVSTNGYKITDCVGTFMLREAIKSQLEHIRYSGNKLSADVGYHYVNGEIVGAGYADHCHLHKSERNVVIDADEVSARTFVSIDSDGFHFGSAAIGWDDTGSVVSFHDQSTYEMTLTPWPELKSILGDQIHLHGNGSPYLQEHYRGQGTVVVKGHTFAIEGAGFLDESRMRFELSNPAIKIETPSFSAGELKSVALVVSAHAEEPSWILGKVSRVVTKVTQGRRSISVSHRKGSGDEPLTVAFTFVGSFEKPPARIAIWSDNLYTDFSISGESESLISTQEGKVKFDYDPSTHDYKVVDGYTLIPWGPARSDFFSLKACNKIFASPLRCAKLRMLWGKEYKGFTTDEHLRITKVWGSN